MRNVMALYLGIFTVFVASIVIYLSDKKNK